MKFEELAKYAWARKVQYAESARTVLRGVKIWPCGDDTQEHANEMAAAAHFRAEAMRWYFRYKKACKQAEEVGK